jgi:GNAT superfamily N-acetyltransferase
MDLKNQAPPTPLAFGQFGADDIDAALALSTAEGWNQTEADWHRLTRLEPDGCFAARQGDRLIGTATTTTYAGTLAWIGMVIVHPTARGRGIGAALMRMALDYLHARGVPTIKLDATPAGRPLYESLGFIAEAVLERWQGVASPASRSAAPAEVAALPHILDLDRAAYGADRSPLVRLLTSDAAAGPLLVESDNGRGAGYALARRGRVATYLGPLIATSAGAARQLLGEMFVRCAGEEVCLDLHSNGLIGRDELDRHGLTKRRELTRMRLGMPDGAAASARVCLSAGPEYG